MTEYSFPFERVKQIKEQLTGISEGDKPKDVEGEPDDEEPRIQEITTTEESTVITSKNEENKTMME
jgi:hypothetical protein